MRIVRAWADPRAVVLPGLDARRAPKPARPLPVKVGASMDLFYFTLIGIGLYFFADRVLDRVERARGARFKHRDMIYFGIILSLALVTFYFMHNLSRGSG
jgi:hypothetical protein